MRTNSARAKERAFEGECDCGRSPKRIIKTTNSMVRLRCGVCRNIVVATQVRSNDEDLNQHFKEKLDHESS